MNTSVIIGILIPFAGTSLGAAFVFFMKRQLGRSVQRALTGFAAGVMTAASVWSLLIPAIEQSSSMGVFAFVPAFVGFWIGTLFLLVLDKTVPHLHMFAEKAEGHKSKLARTTMMRRYGGRRAAVRPRIYRDDGLGCGVGIKIQS